MTLFSIPDIEILSTIWCAIIFRNHVWIPHSVQLFKLPPDATKSPQTELYSGTLLLYNVLQNLDIVLSYVGESCVLRYFD